MPTSTLTKRRPPAIEIGKPPGAARTVSSLFATLPIARPQRQSTPLEKPNIFANSTANKLRIASPGTDAHEARVTAYSADFLHEFYKEIGLPSKYGADSKRHVEFLRRYANKHDIGKYPIASIVNKPGKLSAKEFRVVQQHPLLGAILLDGEPVQTKILALRHHERPDGKGYPTGTRVIDAFSSIVAIADAVDAMITRPYSEIRTYPERKKIAWVTRELRKHAGTQFDPFLAGKFAEMLEDKRIRLKSA